MRSLEEVISDIWKNSEIIEFQYRSCILLYLIKFNNKIYKIALQYFFPVIIYYSFFLFTCIPVFLKMLSCVLTVEPNKLNFTSSLN